MVIRIITLLKERIVANWLLAKLIIFWINAFFDYMTNLLTEKQFLFGCCWSALIKTHLQFFFNPNKVTLTLNKSKLK